MTRRFAPLGALALVLALALTMAACGGRPAPPGAAATSAPMAQPPSSGTPRGQIQQLDLHIQRLRARVGLPAMESMSSPDGASNDGAAAATPSSVPGPDGVPASRDAGAMTCQDVCGISRSICDNAGRICHIARGDLAGDKWAEAMCQRAETSCSDAKRRCTDCKNR